MNNALATLPERAMRVAHQVGDGLKDAVPDRAIKWMETGAAMAALKTGGSVHGAINMLGLAKRVKARRAPRKRSQDA